MTLLVFSSLLCTGAVLVRFLADRLPTGGYPGMPLIGYALVILGSATLALLAHRRSHQDNELRWAYRTLGEGAEERAVAGVVDEVARIVTSTLDIDEVYQRFCVELSRLVDSDRIAIIVVDQAAGTMEFRYVYGQWLPRHAPGQVAPLDHTRTKEVVRSGKTHVWMDTDDEPRFRISGQPPDRGLRAGIATPLVSKGRSMGVLNLRSRRAGAYGSREQAIVRRLAAQIGPAVENAELFEGTRKAEEQIRRLSWEREVVDEVAKVITSTLDIQNVYREFAIRLKQLVAFDRVAITTIDQETRTVVDKYYYGDSTMGDIVGLTVPLEGSRTEQVLMTGETLVLDDIPEDLRFVTDREFYDLGLRASVTAPLAHMGHVFGSLNLRSKRVGAFGPREQTIIERLANQISAAVRNAQLYEQRDLVENELRESEARARALLESAPQGIVAINESGEITQVNDAALEIFGYSRDYLQGRSVDVLLPQSLREGHSERRNDYLSDPENRRMGMGRELQGLRKDGSNIPLEIGLSSVNTERGIVALAFITDISLRKEAEQAERRWARETGVLAEIGRVISSSVDISEVYASLGQQATRLLPFDHMSLSLIDQENGVSDVAWVYGQDIPGRTPGNRVPLDGAFVNEVVLKGSSVVLAVDTEEDLLDRIPRQMPAFLVGMRSFLGVPLFFRDALIGVLQLQSQERDAYASRDSDLAVRIGNQIAGAVATSRLYADRTRLAEENSAMAEVGRIISSSLDVDEVYDRLGEVIQQVIPFDQTALSLIDQERSTVSPPWVLGADIPGRRPGDIISLEGTLTQEVASSRLPLLVSAENEDELSQRFPGLIPHFKAGMRSLLSAPLVHLDGVIGTIQINSMEPERYTQRHLDLAERIAQQIAGAIANSQLFAERLRAEEATQASEQKYRALVNESPDMIFVSRLDDFRFTEVNERACQHYGYSREEFLQLNIFDLEVDPPLKKQVRSLYDNTPEGEVIEVYGTNKCKDGTTFPVRVRFSKLDGELAIANVRDITEQKRAEETQNRLAEENSVMADIGKVISSSLDINDVYELLGAQIKKLIPFDRLVLTIIDRESSASIPTWIIGADVPGRDSGTPIPLAGSVAGEILRTRSASLLNGGLDSDLSERFPGLLPSLEAGLKSFVSTPLIYRDEIIGVLQLRALEMGVYSQQHLELAERIANQIAGAVANALLFAECRRLAEENAVMAEIGKVISSSLDINTVYDRLGEETQRLIQFDRMSLSLYEADARAMSITYVTGTDVPGRQSGAVIPLEGTIGGKSSVQWRRS